VIVENGGWGAEAAAPLARKALDYFLLGKRPGDSNKADGKTDGKADGKADDKVAVAPALDAAGRPLRD